MPTTKISDSASIPLTIQWIKNLIVAGAETDFIKNMVAEYGTDVKKVFTWLWNNIDYEEDPDNLQNVKTVDRILRDGKANCANYCIILGAYLYAIGQPFSVRIAAYNKDLIPEHIYIITNGMVLDLTAGQSFSNGTLVKTYPKYNYEFNNSTYHKDYPILLSRPMSRSTYIRQWYS